VNIKKNVTFFFMLFFLLVNFLPALAEYTTAEEWFNEGVKSLEEKNYENALYCFEKALEVDSDYADAWYKKGVTYYKINGKTTDMEMECYDKALAIYPDHHRSWYAKGWALYEEGKTDEAKLCYDKAVAISPESNYSWYGGDSPPSASSLEKELADLYKPASIISINSLKVSGDWALVNVTLEDDYGVYTVSSLIHKMQGKWAVAGYIENDSTTDLMEYYGLPSSHWSKFLDSESIEKNRPLLDYLHKTKAGYYFEYIRYAGPWAYVMWRDIEMDTEGIALLKNSGGNWELVQFGGGAVSEEEFQQWGVSPEEARELLGTEQ